MNPGQCLDDGRLRYIEWPKCTSRTSELNDVKGQGSLKVWKADASGNIKQSDAESQLKRDVTSELDVMNALKRRGATFELAKLMSYEEHEKIINLLFFELQKEPLEGFKKVSLGQIAAGDREIHSRLAEFTRAGLPRTGPAPAYKRRAEPSVSHVVVDAESQVSQRRRKPSQC